MYVIHIFFKNSKNKAHIINKKISIHGQAQQWPDPNMEIGAAETKCKLSG